MTPDEKILSQMFRQTALVPLKEGHPSIPKRKTRITDSWKLHDAPERAMKVDWPHFLQFDHLAALNRR